MDHHYVMAGPHEVRGDIPYVDLRSTDNVGPRQQEKNPHL